jgi:hypothetical protein
VRVGLPTLFTIEREKLQGKRKEMGEKEKYVRDKERKRVRGKEKG